MVNDTIADMLTRIRNANAMKYKTVEIPGTKMTRGIADILTKEGFIDVCMLKLMKCQEF